MTKNEWLATNVMGWKKSSATWHTKADSYWSKYYQYAVDERHREWNPTDHIEQAMMLLEMFDDIYMFDDIRIMKEFNAADLCIWGVELKGKADCVFRKTLPEAITEAVLQASGYYDYTKTEKEITTWNSVKDKLPPGNGYYLVVVRSITPEKGIDDIYTVDVRAYSWGTFATNKSNEEWDDEITHWKYTPKLPKND